MSSEAVVGRVTGAWLVGGGGGGGSYVTDCNDRLFLNYGFSVPGNPSPCKWDALHPARPLSGPRPRSAARPGSRDPPAAVG